MDQVYPSPCLGENDLSEVYKCCEPVRAKWATLAVHLHVDIGTIDAIDRDHRGISADCLRETIHTWLKRCSRNQPLPSWKLLIDAVAHLDRRLSERISQEHGNCDCASCYRAPRNSPVATAIQQKDVKMAATKLKSDFKELVLFIIDEIKDGNVDVLRFLISDYFEEDESSLTSSVEMHLRRIEDLPTPNAILNYFRRHEFIGYINYALIKVFKEVAKTKELVAKRIEKYEEDYHHFLELSLTAIHDVFKTCPDLRPNYPAGIPKFTIHLQSDWEGSSALELRNFLKHVLDSDCIDHLMIAKITRNCFIITYAVLPHFANRVLQYLTNDSIINTLKKVEISIDISKQLQQYNVQPIHDKDMKSKLSSSTLDDTPKQGILTYNRDIHTDSSVVIDSQNVHVTVETGIPKICHDNNNYNCLYVFVCVIGSHMVEQREGISLKEAINLITVLSNKTKALGKKLEIEEKIKINAIQELDQNRKSVQQLKAEHNKADKIAFRLKWVETVLMNKEKAMETRKQTIDSLRVKLKGQYSLSEEKQKEMNIALLNAARKGDIHTVQRVIQSGADINTRDRSFRNYTPLHYASEKGYTEIVRLLLSYGANVDVNDKLNSTPLHHASISGHTDVVSILLSHGATATVTDDENDTPLWHASANGHIEIVKHLLLYQTTTEDVDGQYTPLHMASFYGHIEVARVLISNGANMNAKDSRGRTPLQRALFSHEKETAQLLLSHGANIYHKDMYGQSAILIATVLGYEQLLLSNGIDSDVIMKYRLPANYEAVVDVWPIMYKNTVTGIEQETHPHMT